VSVTSPREGDSARRREILDTAANLIASSGVRTSIQQIADACGILPGSLYHHFESKEAIFVQLVQRYRNDLDGLARTVDAGAEDRTFEDQVVALGSAIADCAVRHRAAVLLTLYEPPVGADAELVRLAQEPSPVVTEALVAILDEGRRRGDLRDDIDPPLFAERIFLSMVQPGIGVSATARGAERAPAIKCRMLLHGIAVEEPDDARLDTSRARTAADEVIATWVDDEADGATDKMARLRAAARSEFARRGYELTTIRDIAAAAGVSTGAVYRQFSSKEELSASIMEHYTRRVIEGWDRVMESRATPLEKLDALFWFNCNIVDRFSEERSIQLLDLQVSPPKRLNRTWTFPTHVRQLKQLLSEGLASSELQIEGASLDLGARSVFTLSWMHDEVVRQQGVVRALEFDRRTILRGAAVRAGADVTSRGT
jgi:AcrR family transcriptional regulator